MKKPLTTSQRFFHFYSILYIQNQHQRKVITVPNAWDAEQIVSAPFAKTLIETQFPELAPAAISLLGYGFDNTVYQVNDRFVFRFPRRELAVGLLKTENQLLPSLASQLPLSIAEPIFSVSRMQAILGLLRDITTCKELRLQD